MALAFGVSVFMAGGSPAIAADSGKAAGDLPLSAFLKPIHGKPAAHGISAPARSLAVAEENVDVSNMPTRGPRNPMIRAPLKPAPAPWGEPDGALSAGGHAPTVMPPTIQNFEGINNTDNGALFGFTVSPPDTVGDVGRTHYVQAVNLAMRIFNLDGTPATGVFKMSDLFATLGAANACANGDDDGDPIILYDHLADRWLVSQFATEGPPFHQCIAISQTGDPTGSYYVYDYPMPVNKFNDYPHFGVWPDGYYMTDNQFNAALTAFQGAGVFAFDRRSMLRGDPTAGFIYFDLFGVDPNLGGMLAADADGSPPPAGANNVFAMFTAGEFGDPGGDGIRLWRFAPNYETPAASTFTEITTAAAPIPVAAFDPITPNGRADVPQPGTAARVDTIADRLMHRLQYRNFGTHESLVVAHTVDVSGDPSAAGFRAGVRYYELRSTAGGPWVVQEQATHGPADTVHRWMPSAAMDRQGNIAIGFSASDATTVFPSVRYGGRLASDPLGGLMQGEATAQAGSRSQTDTGGSRWGDYSSLTVDPIDDCTFWFTTEYYSAPAPAGCGAATQCWQTRVSSFRFPSCPAAPAAGTISGTVTNAITSLPLAGAFVEAGAYSDVTDASGNYSIFIPPQTVDMTASFPGHGDGTATGVVVASGGTVDRDFALVGVPVLSAPTQTFNDAVNGGNGNGAIEPGECPAITATAVNSGGGTATNVNGTLSTVTPNVSVTTAAAAYGTILPGGNASNTPSYVIQLAPTFQAGEPIALSLDLDAVEDDWTQAFTFNTGVAANAPTAFPFNGPVAIPDNNATGATLNMPVAGLATRVSKVTVAVRITHTFQGDLSMVLRAPDGTAVGLVQNLGGTGNGGNNIGVDCPASGNDLVFDDAAAASITTAGKEIPNFSGTFRPVQPLSGLQGKVGNGTWQFVVVDNAAIDTGTIDCVTLNIDGFSTSVGNCSLVPLPDDMFRDGFENP